MWQQAIVVMIGFAGFLIYSAGENAFHSHRAGGLMEAANPAEHIHKRLGPECFHLDINNFAFGFADRGVRFLTFRGFCLGRYDKTTSTILLRASGASFMPSTPCRLSACRLPHRQSCLTFEEYAASRRLHSSGK